jgi:SAM-dependent methyltransferase
MATALDIVKWSLLLGRSPQSFLGAKWLRRLLDRAPKDKKRVWALRLLSLSPHYFINPGDPQFEGLTGDAYLEKAFQVGVESRAHIYDLLVKPHLEPNDIVMDYGCGPGFLSRAIAPNAKHVYACDISDGALACARVLNHAPNLEYVVADSEGLSRIPDGGVDLVVSFALVQHLTAEVLDHVLGVWEKKLKAGGKLLLHVQLIDDVWKTEDEWKTDRSVKGRIKYRYGLHCFGRTEEEYRRALEKHGFGDINMTLVSNLVPSANFDDIGSQHLITARKN